MGLDEGSSQWPVLSRRHSDPTRLTFVFVAAGVSIMQQFFSPNTAAGLLNVLMESKEGGVHMFKRVMDWQDITNRRYFEKLNWIEFIKPFFKLPTVFTLFFFWFNRIFFLNLRYHFISREEQ